MFYRKESIALCDNDSEGDSLGASGIQIADHSFAIPLPQE